jgi:hypothetical protein
MTLQQRRQNLIKKILQIADEDFIIVLEEQLSNHLHNKIDLSKELTSEELMELTSLINEPPGKNCVSLSDFKSATERWRMK